MNSILMLQYYILLKYKERVLFTWTTRPARPLSCYYIEAFFVVICIVMESTAVFLGISFDAALTVTRC